MNSLKDLNLRRRNKIKGIHPQYTSNIQISDNTFFLFLNHLDWFFELPILLKNNNNNNSCN